MRAVSTLHFALTVFGALSLVPIGALAGELHRIAINGSVAELDDLFASSPNLEVDESDFILGTALHRAAVSNNAKVAEALIARGAGIETVSELLGSHPLHLAAEVGGVETLKVLIRSGASLMSLDANGRTPIVRAAIADQAAAVEFLVKEGVPVDTRDELHGRTALIEAAYVGAVNSAASLIEAGADVDARDNRGKSAIWYASTPESYSPAGGPALLELLASKGADLENADDMGMTPLAWVQASFGRSEGIYREIEAVLLELGARP